MNFQDTELPPPTTKRWVVRRKAAVVAAVRADVITVEEACSRYQLSKEEFLAWQCAFEAHGLPGLSVSRFKYQSIRARGGVPGVPESASRRRKGR
jgi:endonuclease/exonuclease/phosphatase family metal-dependent hydrolase